MYVSVTGLKTKGLIGWVRFWLLAIPALRGAQRADGVLFCETKMRNGYHHTLTVWETKNQMMMYRKSPVHLKAMKVFSFIATGKVYGYESNALPTWDEALKAFDEHARTV